ncbi:MAG: UDP-3-O-acyl-N-acetylglucosamine deacetylase [Nitrospira sp.]|nr:UDP-3-O-acyl-N-acetylglucosamine deacetylase [Nitrospira sp.]MCP9463928.1 UDP-3-O-acyl-N-acetylglucosamine deacetylase [Nitrospira sp.]
MRNQQTLAAAVTCSGIGLHSGQAVTITLRPAPPDTGIVFVVADREISIPASIEHYIPTELCTAVHGQGFQIKTIEHVLSALAGLEVDNVYIDVSGGEIPVMDGSAAPFVRLIRSVGVVQQNRQQPFLKIMAPIEVVEGTKRVRIEPSSIARITYSIQYDHPLINTQTYTYECSPHAYETQIAEARTFGFLHEVQALWARGLGKGGTLENTVVLSKCGVVNQSGLRFLNEFVRHKVLDLIGDFSLLGASFIGHIIAERSGHALHSKLVQRILEEPEKWILLNTEPLQEEKPLSLRMARLQSAALLHSL